MGIYSVSCFTMIRGSHPSQSLDCQTLVPPYIILPPIFIIHSMSKLCRSRINPKRGFEVMEWSFRDVVFCYIILLFGIHGVEVTGDTQNTAGAVMGRQGCYEARHIVVLGTKVLARNELYDKDIESCEQACIDNDNCTAWSYKLPDEVQFLEMPEVPDSLDEVLSQSFDDAEPSCYLVYHHDKVADLTMRYSFGATFKIKDCSEVYLGCYQAGVVRDDDYSETDSVLKSLSAESCIRDCKESNFAYAALQSETGCDCGNTFGAGKFVDNSNCQTPCPEGSGMCGGKNATSIWRTGTIGLDQACVFGKISFNDFEGESFEEPHGLGECVLHCTTSDDCLAWQHNGTHCDLFTEISDGTNLMVANEGNVAGFGSCYGDLNLVYHATIGHPVLAVHIYNGTTRHSMLLNDEIIFWEPYIPDNVNSSSRFLTASWSGNGGTSVPGSVMLYTRAAADFFNQPPISFSLAWVANRTAFWTPLCPANYSALGSVQTGSSMEIPSENLAICLHESLLKEADIGSRIRMQDDSGNDVYLFNVTHNNTVLPNLSSYIAMTSANFSGKAVTLKKLVHVPSDPRTYLIYAEHKGIFDTKIVTDIETLDLLVITSITVEGTNTKYRYRHLHVAFPIHEDLDEGWTTSGTLVSASTAESLRLFRKQQGQAIVSPTGFEPVGTISGHFGNIKKHAVPEKLHFIRVICPDHYHTLGVAALLNDAEFNVSQFSCIHEKFLANVSLPRRAWWPSYAPLHNITLRRIIASSCLEDDLGYSLAASPTSHHAEPGYLLRKHKEGTYEDCSDYSFQLSYVESQIRRMEQQQVQALETGFSDSEEGDWNFDTASEYEGVEISYHQSRSDAGGGHEIISVHGGAVMPVTTMAPNRAAGPSTVGPHVQQADEDVQLLTGVMAENVFKGWGCFKMRHIAFHATPVPSNDITGVNYKDICEGKCRRKEACFAWSYILEQYDGKGNVIEKSQCHHLLNNDDVATFKLVVVQDAFMEFLSCTFSYVGCFEDRKYPRDLPHPVMNSRATIGACREKCSLQGYAYFGLQFGAECWCGNTFGKHRQHERDSECSINCREKRDEMCGSINKNSIYRTGGNNGQMCVFGQATLDASLLQTTAVRGDSVYNCRESCRYRVTDPCVIWEHNGTHCHRVFQSQLTASSVQLQFKPKNHSYVGFSVCNVPSGNQFYRINSSMEMIVKMGNFADENVTIRNADRDEMTAYMASPDQPENEGYFLLGQSHLNVTYLAKTLSGEPLQRPDEMHEIEVNHVQTINKDRRNGDHIPGSFASFWHMDCPPGYSALGDIISRNSDPPALQDYKCVHTDFVNQGGIGRKIWSQADPDEISIWDIAPKNATTDMELDFFKVTDHLDSPEDDEFLLRVLKKIHGQGDKYHYIEQDTAEVETKLTRSFNDISMFMGDPTNGDSRKMKISQPGDLRDGWFYLGFGHPFVSGGGHRTPIVRNIQGHSVKKPLAMEHIVTLPGHLFLEGENKSFSIWRPQCPMNYKALSDIFQTGTIKPASNDIACIHQDLLVPAKTAHAFRSASSSKSSGRRDRYTVTHIMPQDCKEGEDFGFFRAIREGEDFEFYTLRRNSESSLYPMCTDWQPPTEPPFITEEYVTRPAARFEDIFLSGGERQVHFLMKGIAIDAWNIGNYSDLNICREKCENDTQCKAWSFDMLESTQRMNSCFHTYFGSDASSVIIQHKLGSITQFSTDDDDQLTNTSVISNASVLYDPDIATVTENVSMSDCGKICSECLLWIHNSSHCITLLGNEVDSEMQIVAEWDHSIGFPGYNQKSYMYSAIQPNEEGTELTIMEIKEFPMAKDYLILKNSTGRLNIWTPDLEESDWKIMGQKVDLGAHRHDDKIFAARALSGLPMVSAMSASPATSVIGYLRHHQEHEGIESNITLWKMNCPLGYQALGDVVTFEGYPNLTNYACILDEFLVEGTRGKKILSYSGGNIYEVQHHNGDSGLDLEFYTFVSSGTDTENSVHTLKSAPGGIYHSLDIFKNTIPTTTMLTRYGDTSVASTTYPDTTTDRPTEDMTKTPLFAHSTMTLTTPSFFNEQTSPTDSTSSVTTSNRLDDRTTSNRPDVRTTTNRLYGRMTSNRLFDRTTSNRLDDRMTTDRLDDKTTSNRLDDTTRLSTPVSTANLQSTLEMIESDSLIVRADITLAELPINHVMFGPFPEYDTLGSILPGSGDYMSGMFGNDYKVNDFELWGCFVKTDAAIKGSDKFIYANTDHEKCKQTCSANSRCKMWSIVPEDSGDWTCYHVHDDDDLDALQIVKLKYASLGFTNCTSGYIGCHDGDMETGTLNYVEDTEDEYSCLETCREKSHPYSGFQLPKKCMCGDHFDHIMELKKDEECHSDFNPFCVECEETSRYAIHRTGAALSDGAMCIIGEGIDFVLEEEEEQDYEAMDSLQQCRNKCTNEPEKCWMWWFNHTHCKMLSGIQEKLSFAPCSGCLLGFRTCNEQDDREGDDTFPIPPYDFEAMQNENCSNEISFLIAFLVALALLLLAILYICCQRKKKRKTHEVKTLSETIKVGSKLDPIKLDWPNRPKKKKAKKGHRPAIRRSNLPLLLRLCSTEQKDHQTEVVGSGLAVNEEKGLCAENGDEKNGFKTEKLLSESGVHYHKVQGDLSNMDLGSDYITIDGNQKMVYGGSAFTGDQSEANIMAGKSYSISGLENHSGKSRALSSVSFNVNQPYHSYDITPETEMAGLGYSEASAEMFSHTMVGAETERRVSEHGRRNSVVEIQFQPKYNARASEQRMSLSQSLVTDSVKSAAYPEVKVLTGGVGNGEFRVNHGIASVVQRYGFIPISADEEATVRMEESI